MILQIAAKELLRRRGRQGEPAGEKECQHASSGISLGGLHRFPTRRAGRDRVRLRRLRFPEGTVPGLEAKETPRSGWRAEGRCARGGNDSERQPGIGEDTTGCPVVGFGER